MLLCVLCAQVPSRVEKLRVVLVPVQRGDTLVLQASPAVSAVQRGVRLHARDWGSNAESDGRHELTCLCFSGFCGDMHVLDAPAHNVAR